MDNRLRALNRLLRRVEGDDVARVQDAIRRYRRQLEDRQNEDGHPTTFAAREEGDERVLPESVHTPARRASTGRST